MIGCVGESPFTLEPDPLSQDTVVEKDVFFFLCVFVRVHLVGRCCLAFGWLLGIAALGVFLASLEEQEVADELRLPVLGTAARMKTAPERSPSMNKSLLLLYQGSVNDGRTGTQISCISFQKVNTGM